MSKIREEPIDNLNVSFDLNESFDIEFVEKNRKEFTCNTKDSFMDKSINYKAVETNNSILLERE